MQPFHAVRSVPTPFRPANVDTDMIIPARFMKSITKEGLGSNVFRDIREGADGAIKDARVFDDPRFSGSHILLAGMNFGCGSSREHAVWAIAGYGFRCIIAESFAEIFQGNCHKNGILTISLTASEIDTLETAAREKQDINVDLERRYIERPDSSRLAFEVRDDVRENLLFGRDEIAQTLTSALSISRHEQRAKSCTPWLFSGQSR